MKKDTIEAKSTIIHISKLLKKYDVHTHSNRVLTHFSDLDNLINGFANSQLIILAARPAMGKTTLALNIAERVCFKENLSVGIISLEMSKEQLISQLLSSYSNKKKLSDINEQEMVCIRNVMSESNMIISDNHGGLTISDLRERAHQMKNQYGIRLLVVDYLQLITIKESHLGSENRYHDLSEVSRILKHIANELDIPILCLSQISHKVEERPGHRPMMTDLRIAGECQDHADVIMFLLRREYYDPCDKPGLAELIVAKNRRGAIGSINLSFQKEFIKFKNYSSNHYKQENASNPQDDFDID